MTIPTTFIDESDIADEFNFTGSFTGEQIASAMFGSTTADVTSENLAGFSNYSFGWTGVSSFNDEGPYCGFLYYPDGTWSSTSSLGGKIEKGTYFTGNIPPEKLEVLWEPASGSGLVYPSGWNVFGSSTFKDVKKTTYGFGSLVMSVRHSDNASEVYSKKIELEAVLVGGGGPGPLP